MNNNTFDPQMRSLPEEEMPKHLHAKIMKRVFIAGYGRYLYISTAVLFINLGVLSFELYRKLLQVNIGELTKELGDGFALTPSYLNSAISTLYDTLPIQSMAATGITAVLCAYMAFVFVRFQRDPQSISIFRRMAR